MIRQLTYYQCTRGGTVLYIRYGLTAPQGPEPYRREVAWVYSQAAPGVFAGDLWYVSGTKLDYDAR